MAEKITEILACYDFKEIQSIEVLTGGHIGSSYLVVADGEKMVLRMRAQGFSEKDVEMDHKFIKYLSQNSLPVPQIIPLFSGDSFGIKHGSIFEMQSFIPHEYTAEEMDYLEISEEVAGFLGEFHRVSSHFPEEIKKMNFLGFVPVGFLAKYFDGPLKYGMERYLRAAAESSGEEKRELEAGIEFFSRELKLLRARITSEIKSLPLLVNHNDFYGNNILFSNSGKIAGLVDFDFCSTGSYYIDLVELLHGSMVWDENELPYWGLSSDGKVREDKGASDLKTYFRHGPEFPFDQDLFRDMLKTKIISLVFYPAFDMVEKIEERIEVIRRLQKTVNSIDEIDSLYP